MRSIICTWKNGLWCILILLPFVLTAQVAFKFYTTDDGLPSNQIYHIYRDTKGYIWIGHALGLTRFDGNRFKNYTSPLQNSMGVSNIHEDKDGTIWCHNFGGQIFYVRHNVMHLFERYDWKRQVSFPSITITDQNKLVATHPDGFYVYDISGGRDTIIMPKVDNLLAPNMGLANLRGTACLFYGFELFRLRNFTLQQLKPGNKLTLKNERISILLGNFRDTIYGLDYNKKNLYAIHVTDTTYRIVRKITGPEDPVVISNVDAGEAWICAKNNSISITQPAQVIKDYSVTSVLKDKEGNTWIGTLQNGLGLQLPAEKQDDKILLNTSFTEIVNAVDYWNNYLVAVTSKGKILFADTTGKLVKVLHEPNYEPSGVIHTPASGELLIGSNDLLRITSLQQPIEKISKNSSIKDLVKDNEGNTYIADAYGLTKVMPDNASVNIRTKRSFSVDYIGATNSIYCAFTDGLYRYKNKVLTELKVGKQSIYSPSISANGNTLLIASIANGVYLFKNDTLHQHLHTGNGLLSNHIIEVKYFDHKAWILTEVSLDEWDTHTNQITHHTFNQRVVFNNITDFVIWRNRFIITYGGNIRSLPLDAYESNAKPSVYLDHVIVNGRDTLHKNNPFLDATQNDLMFSISGISFNSGKNLQFRYRLKNLETSWTTIPASQTTISFTTLPPGSYTLQLQAVSAKGIVSETLKYAFVIKRPWWKQGWFIFTVLLGAAISLYLGITARIKGIRQKNELMLEKLNLQSQYRDSMLTAIRSQMNPHFIFNALNTIQAYVYHQDEIKASNYLGKFSDLIRRILDYSQKRQITLAQEIEMLQLYIDLETIRFENTMFATVYVDENLSTDTIYIPPMLVQPYVENAIKHGLLHKINNRVLHVRFETNTEGTALLISIEDNGIGRKQSAIINKNKSRAFPSFATMANQKRLDILNLALEQKIAIDITDLTDDAGNPQGTVVVIKIPLSNNNGAIQTKL